LIYDLNLSLDERVVKLQFHGGNWEKQLLEKSICMNLGRSCMQVELSLKLFEEEQKKKKHLANTPFNKV